MIPVPGALKRLADEVDGWLDLRCPERALERLQPLLLDPTGRPAGLTMRIRAYVRMGRHAEALTDIAELRTGRDAVGLSVRDLSSNELPNWLDLCEAWCRKRVADLAGAIRCMEQLIARDPRSDIGHFNLGCYLALAGQRERAIDEVTVACGLTDSYRDLARDEPDLDSLRNDARFRQLMRAGKEPREADEGDEEDPGPP